MLSKFCRKLVEQFEVSAVISLPYGVFNPYNGAKSKSLSPVARWVGTIAVCTFFQGLMQQTFTGQLTAAREAAHADRIAAEQTRRERLLQLVILDFVLDRQRHRLGEPVLITSLSKRRGRLGSRSVTLSLTSMAPSLENSIKISKHWRPVGSSLEPRAMRKGRKSL